MSKLHSIARAANDDMRSRVHFCPRTGQTLAGLQRRRGLHVCEAVFNGVRTLDQVEAMLIETAVDKAHGNLSAASRMLGLTRPQLAYRLKRLHETVPAGGAGSEPGSAAGQDQAKPWR
jgi:transcriptional regulator with GAF, ATPase, and Fis domain